MYCTCDLVDPLLQVCEGDGVGDVEDDDDSVRVAVARRQHGTVPLLATGVPHLRWKEARLLNIKKEVVP